MSYPYRYQGYNSLQTKTFALDQVQRVKLTITWSGDLVCGTMGMPDFQPDRILWKSVLYLSSSIFNDHHSTTLWTCDQCGHPHPIRRSDIIILSMIISAFDRLVTIRISLRENQLYIKRFSELMSLATEIRLLLTIIYIYIYIIFQSTGEQNRYMI